MRGLEDDDGCAAAELGDAPRTTRGGGGGGGGGYCASTDDVASQPEQTRHINQ